VDLDIVPIKCSVVQVITKLGQVFCVLESGGFKILKAFCLIQSENLVYQKLCQIQSEPSTYQMLCLIQSLISLEQQNQSANIIRLVVCYNPQQWTSDHPAGLAETCYILCCPGLCSNWKHVYTRWSFCSVFCSSNVWLSAPVFPALLLSKPSTPSCTLSKP
jgi:hypothetical protein